MDFLKLYPPKTKITKQPQKKNTRFRPYTKLIFLTFFLIFLLATAKKFSITMGTL